MSTYKDVIEILFDIKNKTEHDKEKLLYEIAKTNPSVIVNAYNKINELTFDQKMRKIRDEQSLLHAIKEYRSITHEGLKEAKEYIKSL